MLSWILIARFFYDAKKKPQKRLPYFLDKRLKTFVDEDKCTALKCMLLEGAIHISVKIFVVAREEAERASRPFSFLIKLHWHPLWQETCQRGDQKKKKKITFLFVSVFQGIDVKSMGRIFVGLVKCGAWGCFDEFNRLEEAVLSAVSMQIQAIQDSLKHHKNTCELLGKEVREHSWTLTSSRVLLLIWYLRELLSGSQSVGRHPCRKQKKMLQHCKFYCHVPQAHSPPSAPESGRLGSKLWGLHHTEPCGKRVRRSTEAAGQLKAAVQTRGHE